MATEAQENTAQTDQTSDKKPLRTKDLFKNKPGRLIVRNLTFDIKQKHLTQAFSKFGELVDVNVPLNSESNLNKGFGFVEFKTREEATKAIAAMNAKTYKGRLISVDFAMSKNKYNKKIEEIIEKNPIKNKAKLEELKGKTKKDAETDSWSSGYNSAAEAEEKPEPKHKKKQQNGEHKQNTADKKEKSADKKPAEEQEKPLDKKDKKRLTKNTKKYENDVKEGLTLFVRNIDYKTTEADLKEFFGDFGEIQFVRLVKSRDNPEVHKGSAFVKFKETEPVEKLAKISNDYWSVDKRQVSKSYINDLESQLEFRGRRLAMFKAESRQDRVKNVEQKNAKVDKRNKDLLKVGLVTTKDFVHSGVSDSDMETRIRLFKEKQNSIKKNPNLFVSKTRMCVRNLDRRMDEKALKEFCNSFMNDWKDTLTPEELKEANQQKLIHQFKILKDKNRVDETGQSKSSGIGFIEVGDHNLAMYLVCNMNNFVMNKKRQKGLIVDFALEDHRKLLKRKQKLESMQKKLKEAREEDENLKGGKKDKKEKQKKREKKAEDKDEITIDQITDIPKLRELMKATNSRGKRNRIKRRIQRLNGEVPTEPRNSDHKAKKEKDAAKEEKEVTSKKDKKDKKDKNDKKGKKEKKENKDKSLKNAVENESDGEESEHEGNGKIELSQQTKALLKQKRPKSQDQVMEDQIKNEVKRNKRKRKQKQREEDEMDDVMKTFEDRINKRLKMIEEAGDDDHIRKEGKEFDEVEIDYE